MSSLLPPLLVNLSILIERPTGISVYVQNLLPFLKPLNPILFSAQPIPGFTQEKIPHGLSPASGSKAHLKRLCWLQRQMPRYYHQNQPGLIFSPSPEAPLYRGCRFIVTAHDAIPLRFSKDFPKPLVNYFRYYVSRVLSQAEHIICNSAATARDLSHFYSVPAHKLTPIALAYDAQHFRPHSTHIQNYFLYIGRQNAHKNLSRLISAFEQVHRQQPELELWLVGPTDKRYTPTLMAQCQSLGLTDQVHFLDYVTYDQLPELLGGAIALTFPSLWEGFGLPVLEAMACGTPVITSNLSSLPEVTGDAAILIDPYSIDELADAMEQVARNSLLRQQLSIAGLARAKGFRWEKTGQQTTDVIRRFL